MSDFPLCKELGLHVYKNGWEGLDSELVVSATDLEALLAKGVRVKTQKLGESNLIDEHGPGWMACEDSVRSCRDATHTALLINIKPIVPKTLKDEILEILEDHTSSSASVLLRIRRLIEK